MAMPTAAEEENKQPWGAATALKGSGHKKKSAVMTLRTDPPMTCPRELETVLVASLRALFGAWEPYSARMTVTKLPNTNADFVIRCQNSGDTVDKIRVAATMVSTPAFMNSGVLRLDVVDVSIV